MSTPFSQYQRVGVFVDVQNMFYSAKNIHKGSKLNFLKLMDKAVRGRQLIRAICYVIENPEIDQSSFLEMLTTKGYEIKKKMLRTRADGSAKGDWDMGIAIDAVSLAEKLDIVVLVSGDGDFSDLVYHLKSRGVLVEVISFPRSTNEDLIKAVDLYIPIETDLLIPPSGQLRRRPYHKNGSGTIPGSKDTAPQSEQSRDAAEPIPASKDKTMDKISSALTQFLKF